MLRGAGILRASAATFQRRATGAGTFRMGARRWMGSGGGGHFHVSPIHKNVGMVYMVVMWLWMMYRAKEDGAVVLGLVHPWDAHGGHGHDHAHDEEEEEEDDED